MLQALNAGQAVPDKSRNQLKVLKQKSIHQWATPSFTREQAAHVDGLILRWACRAGVTWRQVDHPAFLAITKALHSGYDPPGACRYYPSASVSGWALLKCIQPSSGRTKLGTELLARENALVQVRQKELLDSVQEHITVSMDGWTSVSKASVYMVNGILPESGRAVVLGCFDMSSEVHTADNLAGDLSHFALIHDCVEPAGGQMGCSVWRVWCSVGCSVCSVGRM